MRGLAPRALFACLLSIGLLAGLAATAQASPEKSWHIKITNLTPQPASSAGQPMSAPLWAVHNRRADVWSVGKLASSGVLGIVEDANNPPLQTSLNADPNVLEAATGGSGPFLPGGTREFDVTTSGQYMYLSTLWMLVRTNDGFTGLDSYRLDRPATIYTNAYDGGTERNNEDCAYIPGPPCNHFFAREPTADPIAPHLGILGIGPAGNNVSAFTWDDPVAKIEITRNG